jgi:hypothetical protein
VLVIDRPTPNGLVVASRRVFMKRSVSNSHVCISHGLRLIRVAGKMKIDGRAIIVVLYARVVLAAPNGFMLKPPRIFWLRGKDAHRVAERMVRASQHTAPRKF